MPSPHSFLLDSLLSCDMNSFTLLLPGRFGLEIKKNFFIKRVDAGNGFLVRQLMPYAFGWCSKLCFNFGSAPKLSTVGLSDLCRVSCNWDSFYILLLFCSTLVLFHSTHHKDLTASCYAL